MSSSHQSNRQKSRIRLPLWVLTIIGFTFFTLFVYGSWALFQIVRETTAQLEFSNPDFGVVSNTASNSNEPTISVESDVNDEPGEPLPVLSADALEPWSGNERVSILLLGIDQRCEEDGPTHTDSMMVLTIDPVGLSAAVLSIPRDLWVEIPGFGMDRINQANYFGEAFEYPGGGPALAQETVEGLLGVPIDYYVAVNFDAFIDFVDAIGGITIDVSEPIVDETYPDRCYGYDPFRIEAGEHTLDGTNALKYARTRATFGGDVDRAQRQQAVILAVRDKVLRLNMMPQLIAQAPVLWQSLQENVRTNFSLDEVVQLALLAQDIPRDSIQTAVIDFNYVYNETTPDGRQVLVPNRDEIRNLRDLLFRPPVIPTPVIENLPMLMKNESARVAVYNGTTVFGLAGATQTYLQSFDVNVVEIGNADSAAYRKTRIIDYGNHPSTTLYLTQLMHVPPLNVRYSDEPAGDFDILVIIGDDWRVPGS